MHQIDIPEFSAHIALVFESIGRKLDTLYYAKEKLFDSEIPYRFLRSHRGFLLIQTIREDEKKMRKNEKIL